MAKKTSQKSIDTLIEDIDSLFLRDNYKVSEDNLEIFGENVKKLLKESLESAGSDRDFTIRMSNYGTPHRKLWYESKYSKESTKEDKISPATYRKFLFGHILEELLLFLIKESGHSLTSEQEEVEISGVLGHMDCVIDGEVTDIKSASTFSFGKFVNGSLLSNDPFGYIAQLSGYSFAKGKDKGYFFVIDKQHGELTLLKVDDLDMINPEDRIKEIRENLSKSTPPDEKCYEPKIYENGNKELNTSCYYCHFKEKCWKDANDGKGIRWFEYAGKTKGLVHVESTPRVKELT
jgi:hypothetical protein